MRFFITLEIPDPCREELSAVQQRLKEIIPEVRLTNNEKLHLTIAFIGEQPDKLTDDLIEVIKKATLNIHPFEIAPAYIDGFPALHHAHTFWMGVRGDIGKLMVTCERIKDGLIKLGLNTDDRRYIPHIAIGKVNGNFKLRPFEEEKLQQIASYPFTPIKVSSIKLFQSIPDHGFHRHNTLAEIPLS